jgi:dTDP-4-amino-4,6-dideoxygalactose transaminase
LAYQHQQLRDEVQGVFMRVYDGNWFILGKELEGFENEFGKYTGAPFCLGVGNGLDALTLSLLACNIAPGDEVIVPAHTYIATWLAISKAGARIVPVEPDENTLNIDVTKIESAITPRTKAILPVHLYGQACNMTVIDQLARRHNLVVIEDFAQAHGTRWLEKRTGSFGTVNGTSFYPTKNLAALGDGGAVTTFETTKAEFIRRYRNYGFEQKNIGSDRGVNSRLDEIQAAVLRLKLKHLDEWNEQRRELAALYLENLKDTGDIILPLSDKEAYHVYHLFVIRTSRRDALKAHLASRGVETMVHYPIPPHLQKTYQDLRYRKGDFPLTERIADAALSLPLWPGMTKEQVEYVCHSIEDFF